NAKTGQPIVSYRDNERFPMTSTFKLVLSAAILHQSMSQPGLLQKKVTYQKSELVSYSPVTEPNQSKGMTIEQLCVAAMQHSDNSAANLLIKELGDIDKVNQFARTLVSDSTFKLSRLEPELNSAIPGDDRDTVTPQSMAKKLQHLIFTDILGQKERNLLISWLKGNTTGDASIRAGAPKNWQIGDKTGGGAYGTTNDVAVLWPEKGEPMILSIYFTQNDKKADLRRDVLAEATRIVLSDQK
ncbi:MAG: class A beta-lactamase, partial [Enterobacteriaceae bacterium]